MNRIVCRALPVVLLICAPGCQLPEGPDPGLGSSTSALDEGPPMESPALELRFHGAERVVVGTVDQVSAAFGLNEHGDRLIISSVALQVRQTLRGEAVPRVVFELEGGTLGELTLEVSDLPRLRPGDHGVFALRRTLGGSWVPNGRGLGLLRIAPDAVDLPRLRRAEELSR